VLIEESITIEASIAKVWETFSDVTCWKDWNSVLEDETTGEPSGLEPGKSYRWCLRPFSVPVHFEPVIDEILPREKIVWQASKLGIHARHEFLFTARGDHTVVTSREVFRGITPALTKNLFLESQVRNLTTTLLRELKQEVERIR